MQSEEILAELAAQTDGIREFYGATFEQLEDYWAIADARLSAFSSEQMWAVAIEIVGYDAKSDEFSLRVYLFGNCLNLENTEYELERTILMAPNAWNKEIEKDQVWGIARDKFSLLFRGQRHDFAPTLEELKNAGVELSAREIESGELSPPQMLRFVCEKLDHPFFMSEDALRDSLDGFAHPFEWKYDEETQRSWYQSAVGEFAEPPLLSVALQLILQTRDWIHPRAGLADGSAGEWEISPREAFAVLAQTLAERDVAAWNAQDAAIFNSHWRNWADIEANKDRIDLEALKAVKAEFRAFITAIVPLEGRAELLRQMRPMLEEAPSLAEGLQIMFIERDDKPEQTLRICRELLEEADAMLAELRNNR